MSDGISEALNGTYFQKDKNEKIVEIKISGNKDKKSELSLLIMDFLKAKNFKVIYDNNEKRILVS